MVGAEEIDNAASAHEISGLYDTYMSEYDYQGDQVIFASGYSQIVGALAANASAARIILNTTIVGVHDAGGARGVTLVAGDSRQFTAAHVISTLPLGVLKAGAVLFDPPLPAAKQAVIERMGFGSFHKTFLVFDRPFWEDRESCWLFHQSPTRNQTATRAFQYWLNMYSFTGVPFLIAVNIGDNARALFALDTPRVQALALEALGEMCVHF